MNKDKKQQIILIVLIPVFLVSLIYMRMQKGPGQASVKGMAPEEMIILDTSIDAMPGPKTDFISEYSSGQDPFKNLLQLYLYQTRKAKPVEKAILPLPKLMIEGIIWNTHMPQAIVNGQVVRIGDTVSGVKIMKIEKQGITIDYSGESVLIKR
jgi:hypothetical protein